MAKKLYCKQLSAVAPINCVVVTRMKPVVRMRVGSGLAGELSSVGLCFLPFFPNALLLFGLFTVAVSLKFLSDVLSFPQ